MTPLRRWTLLAAAAAAGVVLTAGMAGAATPGAAVIYDSRGNVVRIADTAVDPDHCGGWNQACSGNHVSRACVSGTCGGACASGWGDCNANKQSDGCETSLSTVSDCGGCGRDCAAGQVCRPRNQSCLQ